MWLAHVAGRHRELLALVGVVDVLVGVPLGEPADGGAPFAPVVTGTAPYAARVRRRELGLW